MLTYAAKTMGIVVMRFPTLLLNSLTSLCETNTANRSIGITIRNIVITIDLTSGPNISLPPRKNLCMMHNENQLTFVRNFII